MKTFRRISGTFSRLAFLICLLGPGFLPGCTTPQAAQENSDMADAHYKLGVASLGMNDLQRAFVEFQRAVKFDPGDKKIRFALAQVYDLQERTTDAERELKEALRLDPGYSEAHNYLGTIFTKTRRYSDALESFRRALANPLYQTPQMAHYNMGLTYQAMDHPADAVSKFRESTRIDPSFMPGYMAWGRIAGLLGQYKEAVEAYRGAISLRPDALDVRLEMAIALFNDRQDTMAIEEFRRIVREDAAGTWADSARRYLEVLQK